MNHDDVSFILPTNFKKDKPNVNKQLTPREAVMALYRQKQFVLLTFNCSNEHQKTYLLILTDSNVHAAEYKDC